MWMQGQAMQPLEQAEQAVASKMAEIGQEFCHTVFSGISPQELKKQYASKDTTYCITLGGSY